MAFPHHRHQSSLEGVIDLSSPQPLEPDQRDRATRIFNQIVAHFEPSQAEDKGYKRVTLIRAAHEYTLNRDNFLHCFFRDGHRCVIYQKFDIRDAMKRVKRDKNNAKDDDGRLLINEREAPEYLEVAHILPHSLMSLAAGSGDSQLVCHTCVACSMFR